MKSQKYVIGLDGSGIDELLAGISEYQKWLESRVPILVERLAQKGYEVASVGFGNAVYDGTNDTAVHIEAVGDKCKAVVALGDSALFIEFGSGIYYPDNHPDKPIGVAERGTYGKGHGKQRTWGYYGDNTGTNGKLATKKNGEVKVPHVVLTHGNPANMPMFKAVKEIESDFQSIVNEVFV